MKNDLPEVVYIANINLRGLYSKKPIKAKLDPLLENTWFDSRGDISVSKMGEDDQDGNITFASVDKKEVQIWINGVLSCQKLLRDWTG